MMRIDRRVLAVLALVTAAGSSHAQEDAAPAAAPVKPRPAEIAPLATRSLLLDIANNGKRIVAVGDRGQILVSSDGQSWAQVEVPVRSPLTAVSFSDENNGLAVGHDAVILRTRDGGRNWALQNFEPELEKPFLDVVFLDGQRGYAVGAYGLLYATADGGDSWAPVEAPEILEDELHLNSIVKLNDGELFVAGETGLMGISTDGEKWSQLQSPYEGSMFGALPVGPKGVMVFGLRGNVYVSADPRNGKWDQIDAGTEASFFGGSVLPDGNLALVGLSGAVLVTDAQGGNPRRIASGLSSTQSAVVGLKDSLLLVGELGLKTISLKQ